MSKIALMEYKFGVIKIVPVNTIKAWPEFFYFSWFLSLLCIFMTEIDLKNEGISHANLVTHFNFRIKHMKIVLDSHYYFCITHYFSADLAYFSKSFLQMCTVFENHRKSCIQHCERSELRLHYEWAKVNWKCQNGQFWWLFKNLRLTVKQCCQTGFQKLAKIDHIRHF